MRIEPVTPPAEEPIDLDEAKLHLRMGGIATQDALITSWIQAAREQCENDVSRAFVTQTFDLFVDCFPFGGGFYLRQVREQGPTPTNWLPRSAFLQFPRPPLQSVSVVEYVDPGGVTRTLDPGAYRVLPASRRPGRIEPAYGTAWPSTQPVGDAVRVRFTAGYGSAAAVPKCVGVAMQLLVGHWNENREATTDAPKKELPLGVKNALNPVRWGRYS